MNMRPQYGTDDGTFSEGRGHAAGYSPVIITAFSGKRREISELMLQVGGRSRSPSTYQPSRMETVQFN